MRRPIGITFLGILNLTDALRAFGLALGFLLAPHLLSSILVWFDNSVAPFSADEYGLAHRVLYFFLACLFGVLFFIYAWGFWRLKNWARVICIFFCICDLAMATGGALSPLPYLLSEKLAPVFWPHSHFVMSGLLGSLLNYMAATIVLAYLLRFPVKQAFGANPGEWKWITGVAALALISLGHSLYKSGPELEAIRWHARHGDQIFVNGVSFPVYYWHVPTIYGRDSGFSITDLRPGPLRPRSEDSFMSLDVLGFREDQNSLTVDQLVDQKIQYFGKSGYTKFNKFHLNIAKQTLSCMSENEFGSHGPVYCYGEGPIFSIYFVGGERSSKLFEFIMSAAK